MAIKAAGGLAVVQDPDEALYPAMPRSAMEHVTVDAVLPIANMGAWILEKDPTRVPAAPAPSAWAPPVGAACALTPASTPW